MWSAWEEFPIYSEEPIIRNGRNEGFIQNQTIFVTSREYHRGEYHYKIKGIGIPWQVIEEILRPRHIQLLVFNYVNQDGGFERWMIRYDDFMAYGRLFCTNQPTLYTPFKKMTKIKK